MSIQHYQRVLTQLCELVGFADTSALAEGAKLRIDDYVVCFFHDETETPSHVAVYVDLGAPRQDRLQALEVLMQLNFSLGAGSRGVLSIHPQTQRVFYSFNYRLDDAATGQALLDTLIRCVGDVGLDALAVHG